MSEKSLEQKTMMVQKLIEERDAAIVRAERAECLLALSLNSWGKQVKSLRAAYAKLRNKV